MDVAPTNYILMGLALLIDKGEDGSEVSLRDVAK